MIQAEHKEWIERMFPDQPPVLPATVMLEEVGELLQALSKKAQAETYGLDSRYDAVDWRAEIVDAIGDCGISACSLCNASGWDFQDMLQLPAAAVSLEDALLIAVDLITVAAALVIDPYSRSLASRYMELLRAIAEVTDVHLEKAIVTTWIQVKERHK